MDNYYEIMEEHYANLTDKEGSLNEIKDMVSDLIQQGYLTYKVLVDGIHKKEMLIYEHNDPIEGKEADFRAICLDPEHIHMGNVVELEDGRSFIAITKPDFNGAYVKYKIRETTDDVTFPGSMPSKMKAIVANKGVYDETSFINEQNVFEDKDLYAVLIQYNTVTKALTLFDDIVINDIHYKIVKIDDYTFKEYDEDFGIIQLVVIQTPFGEIVKRDEKTTNIKGIVMAARVKDKVLNSIARELLCEHNLVSRGDYIDFTYSRDKQGNKSYETYMIMNRPTMGKNYDLSLMYLCEVEIVLLDHRGECVKVPVYYENNRVRIDKVSENEHLKLKNSSYLIMLQQNDLTNKLRNKVNRIMIQGEVYKVTGYECLVQGILSLGLEIDQLTPDDNTDLGIANYYSQLEAINGGSNDVEDTMIIEANGEMTLCKGFENEYMLKDIKGDVVWRVEEDWISIRQSGNRCWISFNELQYVGRTITLYASFEEQEYSLKIQCVNL